MHAFEDTINQYLNTSGVVIIQPFTDIPGTNPVLRFISITHMNLNMAIGLDGLYVHTMLGLGNLPKQHVAPLLRRLLVLNGSMGGPYFNVDDNTNSLALTLTRQQEGLDLSEFKWMLDQVSSNYWQYAAGLIQEFQIPQQPV